MPDLFTRFDLAIIAIEINGQAICDVDAFGFRVFRGQKISTLTTDQRSHEVDVNLLIASTIQKVGMKPDSLGIVTHQFQLKERINGFKVRLFSHEMDEQKKDFASMLHVASEWLDSGEVEIVMLLENEPKYRITSAVLVCTSTFAANNAKQVLTFISGVSEKDDKENQLSIKTLFDSSLTAMDLDSDQVGLILTSGALNSAPEMITPQDLVSIFPFNGVRSCALSEGYNGLSSVIKAAWCLYNRVIPGSPEWTSPKLPQNWNNSVFYVPTESRTWFSSTEQPNRVAITINSDPSGISSVLLLQEGSSRDVRINAALRQEPFYLFSIEGSMPAELLQNLESFKERLADTLDLGSLSKQNLMNFQTNLKSDDLIACILGHDREETTREIEFALKGIPNAVEKNSDWRTPLGSYMTPVPLGVKGQVSFVYPGAFNSYPGVGRDLFYLFPALYNRLSEISNNLSDVLDERMLYPRSISAFSSADLDEAEKKLSDDPLAMLISGTCLAAVFTFLLRDYFGIHPASAFGYSLGEISMMFASGAWTEADATSAALRASPLFQTRLAGPQDAVRESWGLPIMNQFDSADVIFSNFVLMADPETVNRELEKETRVFMTHINTPRQVVIAGDPAACRKVIERLKCNSLQAPFNYALHCQAMQSEYSALQSLLTWPIAKQPDMKLYSAAEYQAMPIEQDAVAKQIAQGLCRQLDFPRLVNQAYSDGARIFIELGAGSNCSRWVDESLKSRSHASFSINRKGLEDHAAVLQLLSKLISHHVQLNLSALFN